MKRSPLTLIITCLVIYLHAQQPCSEYLKLISEGKSFIAPKNKTQISGNLYKQALNKFNAAKLCDPSKAANVDSLINIVFDAIQNERDNAVKLEKRAYEAQRKAQERTNDVNSLYWTSESEKLVPMQEMRLLEYAHNNTKNIQLKIIIQKKIEDNFNGSLHHRYLLIDQTHSMAEKFEFSSDGRWLVSQSKIWDLRVKKQPDFLSKQKFNKLFVTENSKWLITVSYTHLII